MTSSPEVPRGRLVFVRTSPAVAPGLLTAPAWDLLRSARVFTATTDHPHAGPLRESGVAVEVLGELSAAGLLAEAAGSTVAWLAGSNGDPELAETVIHEVAARRARGEVVPTVETLVASHDLPGSRLIELVAVMDRLRSPGGCPWDAQQTHRSLATYLVEETYETLEAIETGDDADLREELGDLLLQVVFHARIA
ncbi:MAG: MazG nucleotide pyrophosphohydrolase domain-containing protein, partial [Jiangellaceae bacterium]